MELTLTAGRRPPVATAQSARVTLRPYPHPFRAALTVCSDLDLTPDWRAYIEIQRFLNTSGPTSMGPGAGLELGNSIYFSMPPDQFAYDTTDDAGRAMIRALIHSGHIDVLHSYGDSVRTRDQVRRCIDELVRHDCRLSVWVDHSKAPTNFGPDIMFGSGDVRTAPVYHADLTLAYGIRHVWRGRTTSVIGQGVPIGWRGVTSLLNPHHPLAATRTMLKQCAKILLGRRRRPRWEMYADNRVQRASTLRDGQRISEFLRSNPFWGGCGHGDTADGIGEVLSEQMLRTLVTRGGICILYTHLGKTRDPSCPFGPSARAAFHRLARFEQEGQVFVTTTRRLLDYLRVRDCLEWSARLEDGTLTICAGRVLDPITGAHDPLPAELEGLTFEGPRCTRAALELADGTRVPARFWCEGGRCSVSVPWRRLKFPDL